MKIRERRDMVGLGSPQSASGSPRRQAAAHPRSAADTGFHREVGLTQLGPVCHDPQSEARPPPLSGQTGAIVGDGEGEMAPLVGKDDLEAAGLRVF
jgi:hypothetical protein